MRFLCRFAIVLLLVAASFWPASVWAAEEGSNSVANIYILRTAEQLLGPHVVTYRVFEWTQERGRWIMPDFGYYDTGYGKDQIWFAGAGAKLVHTRHVDWEQELYVSQEAGSDSKNRRALWIWPVVGLRFPARLSAQVAAYPTVPLDRAQRWGYDVDRAKIERTLSPHWKVGAGYAGGICDTRTWQSNPFATASVSTRHGVFEVWLQKIPGGSQAQVRYLLVRGE